MSGKPLSEVDVNKKVSMCFTPEWCFGSCGCISGAPTSCPFGSTLEQTVPLGLKTVVRVMRALMFVVRG